MSAISEKEINSHIKFIEKEIQSQLAINCNPKNTIVIKLRKILHNLEEVKKEIEQNQ